MKTCSTCLYWLPQVGSDQAPETGLCRRNPPTPMVITVPVGFGPDGSLLRQEQVTSFFPSMMPDGWCGAHTAFTPAVPE
jgi:hypothetical protein